MKARLLVTLAMLCASLAVAAPALATSDPQANNLGYDEPGFTTVKVHGTVADGTCNPNPCDVSYHFEYGKTTALGTSTTTKTVITNSQVFEDLANLDPGTHYYFTLVVSSGGQTHTGGPVEFTTKAHNPPTATTNDASNVTYFDAKVNGTVGNGATGYFFEWGTSPGALTNTTPARNSATNVNETLSNLAENTTYYFRVVAKKTDEADVRGETKSFKTTIAPWNADDDGDGFKNSDDICPNQAGPAAGPYNQRGCPVPPDGDADGVPDYQDSCPGTPGLKDGGYPGAGCPPPPDADGDGYPDMNDPCPNEKGGEGHANENNAGCPRVDRDGDGYFDSDDGCAEPGGPAIPENGNKNGCPVNDQDGDGIPDIHDVCPTLGHIYATDDNGEQTAIISRVRPPGHKFAGCTKMNAFWYSRGPFPTMKYFLNIGAYRWAMLCGRGGSVWTWAPCKITQTLSFDAATTKKLKLKSPVIDTISDSSPGRKVGLCTACYMFNPGPVYEIPSSIKKKLASLKSVTILLTVYVTDTTLNEKSTYGTKFVVGDKKDPKPLEEL